VYTLAAPNPTFNDPNWDMDVIFFAHPVISAYVHFVQGATDVEQVILNASLGGPFTYLQKFIMFGNYASRYRMTHMGATFTPSMSALTNAGTVIAAQYPIAIRKVSSFSRGTTNSVPSFVPKPGVKDKRKEEGCSDVANAPELPIMLRRDMDHRMLEKLAKMDLRPTPNAEAMWNLSVIEAWVEYYKDISALNTLPNTYVGQAKDGAYSCYKLSAEAMKWRSTREVHGYENFLDVATFESSPNLAAIPCPVSTNPSFPYYMGGWVSDGSQGNAVYERSDPNVMHVSFRGCHAQASFQLTIRQGWELEVVPGSPIAPFVAPAIPPDAIAIAGYAAIIRQLKDCYPEAYNSWEKLVDVIEQASNAANMALPGVGLIGKAARWIYDATSGAGKKANAATLKSKQAKEVARTAASVQAAQSRGDKMLEAAAQSAAPSATGRKKKRNRKRNRKAGTRFPKGGLRGKGAGFVPGVY
jgi:guanyl-specific ribonuclease Sa